MKFAFMLSFAAAITGGLAVFWTAWRARISRASCAFAAGMLLLAAENLFAGLSAHADVNRSTVEFWERWRLLAMGLQPALWLVFSLTFARGNGREFVRQWRWLTVAVLVPPAVAGLVYFHTLAAVTIPDLTPDFRLVRLTIPGQVLQGVCVAAWVLVLANLEKTFRAAVGTMRWRIKFITLGLGVFFAVRIFTGVQMLLMRADGVEQTDLVLDGIGLILGCAVMARSIGRDPLAVMVYPDPAVLKNSVIITLAGVYLLVVGVFAKFAQLAGHVAGFERKVFFILLAVIAVAVAAFSDRVRLQVRRFLSRYFQRPLYDYRSVWRSFTNATASRVEPGDLCEAAVKQVAEIFQALSVSIWLVDDKRENLVCAASTGVTPARAAEVAPAAEAARAIIAELDKNPEPREIENLKAPWAAALRQCHPSQFRTGGARVCVPMHAGRRLAGVMTLGDRVGGLNFSLQDFDLLKCVGDQVAAGLMNAQLSQKLLQNKEMEAFQTMSAFFVHDLKNTASTLNLMLKNLPVHFDNPEFRADALRGVGKTCEHINHLISRLSQLRHDLQLHLAEGDLGVMVEDVLAAWGGAPGVTVAKEVRTGTRISFDKEQMRKVVMNLLLNAAEAVPAGAGRISVAAGRDNGWAVVTVADNGCGMAPDFLRNALFRPFQTTKKNGFGIGMFQSKMIVEAHGGRIEVQSEPGRGATFRVFLPAPPQNP